MSAVGIAISSAPTVGWFPLGYGEPYIPPYSGSRNYFHNVNVSNTHITNITNVTNNYYNTTNVNNNVRINNRTTNITDNTTIMRNNNRVPIRYANQEIAGAVTAVPSNVVSDSQPVAKTAVQLSRQQMKDTSVAAAPPVVPSRTSVLGNRSEASRDAAAPPQQSNRQVVRKVAAPPAPVPFSAKQEALSNNAGRPLDRDTEDRLRSKISRQASETTADRTRSFDPKSVNTNAAADASKNDEPRNEPSRNRDAVKPTPATAYRPAPRPQSGTDVARPDTREQGKHTEPPRQRQTADHRSGLPNNRHRMRKDRKCHNGKCHVLQIPCSVNKGIHARQLRPLRIVRLKRLRPAPPNEAIDAQDSPLGRTSPRRVQRQLETCRSRGLSRRLVSPAPELRPASQPPSNNPSINRDPFRRPSRNSDTSVSQPGAPRVQSRPERLPSNNRASVPAQTDSRPQRSAPKQQSVKRRTRSASFECSATLAADKPSDSRHPSTPR